jgi:phosphoenolpyruvate carboxylase
MTLNLVNSGKLSTMNFQKQNVFYLKIAGHKTLMENYPDGIASIQIRERIVLPLLTIQQYALLRINELNKEKVLMKS